MLPSSVTNQEEAVKCTERYSDIIHLFTNKTKAAKVFLTQRLAFKDIHFLGRTLMNKLLLHKCTAAVPYHPAPASAFLNLTILTIVKEDKFSTKLVPCHSNGNISEI